MVARERDGLPPYEPKPDGVEMISYSAFYDSMFELADAECGRTGNNGAARLSDRRSLAPFCLALCLSLFLTHLSRSV